jgi:glucose-1-phosphate cytidylyltransferase
MKHPAVILAGGMGTRLREETEYRPKPMVNIGSRPILWHIMMIYAHHGIRDFILCLGYKGEMIREHFFNYQHSSGDVVLDMGTNEATTLRRDARQPDWRVLLADTGLKTMTGGRIRRIREYVEGDHFFLTYGDGVADVDIGALLETHRRGGRIATVTAVKPSSRFGEIMIDSDRVTAFAEKEVSREGGWINGGFFVFSPEIFDLLDGDDTVLEQSPLRALAERGELTVHRHTGFWQCMDTYREMTLLNDLWERGEAPWRVWEG